METYTGAEAFVDVLSAFGVEHIFLNPGIDSVPVQAAILERKASNKPVPKLILCLDESVAVAAAHGYYMVSGRPQIVMIHAEIGTLQIGGTLHNVQWGRVPVVICAGSFTEEQRLNWRQQAFDQGSIVRNSVKWDHRLSVNENIRDGLQQAFQIALTEPCGPVYLYYPLEALEEKIDRKVIAASAKAAIPVTTEADLHKLNKAADILIEAENPLIVAGYSGRYPQSVPILIELAETICAPVLTGPTRMNFPTTHPLCAGVEQIGGSRKGNACMAESDAVLVIDYDMPYVGGRGIPGPDVKIIQIGIDNLTQGRPLWDREANIFIKADSRTAIPSLNKIINSKLTPEKHARFGERFNKLKKRHEDERDEWHTSAVSSARQKPISPDWLSNCIAGVIDENAILLNFTLSHSASVVEQIARTEPGTLLSCAGGSIQWALGAALGVKLAASDKTVVSLMTDGGFVWGCPVSTLWSAVSYDAPFLSVIFNNQGYGVIRGLIENVYTKKKISDKTAFEIGVDIFPSPDYATVAKACGAYGRMVEDPADVLPALKEAIHQVYLGKPAVLDVRLER